MKKRDHSNTKDYKAIQDEFDNIEDHKEKLEFLRSKIEQFPRDSLIQSELKNLEAQLEEAKDPPSRMFLSPAPSPAKPVPKRKLKEAHDDRGKRYKVDDKKPPVSNETSPKSKVGYKEKFNENNFQQTLGELNSTFKTLLHHFSIETWQKEPRISSPPSTTSKEKKQKTEEEKALSKLIKANSGYFGERFFYLYLMEKYSKNYNITPNPNNDGFTGKHKRDPNKTIEVIWHYEKSKYCTNEAEKRREQFHENDITVIKRNGREEFKQYFEIKSTVSPYKALAKFSAQEIELMKLNKGYRLELWRNAAPPKEEELKKEACYLYLLEGSLNYKFRDRHPDLGSPRKEGELTAANLNEKNYEALCKALSDPRETLPYKARSSVLKFFGIRPAYRLIRLSNIAAKISAKEIYDPYMTFLGGRDEEESFQATAMGVRI